MGKYPFRSDALANNESYRQNANNLRCGPIRRGQFFYGGNSSRNYNFGTGKCNDLHLVSRWFFSAARLNLDPMYLIVFAILLQYDLALLALSFAWLGWEVYVNNERRGQGLLTICWLLLNFSCFALVEKGLQDSPIIPGVMFSFAVYSILHNRQNKNGNF